MLAKLSEALFVDTLRRYVAGLPERQMGPSSEKASDYCMAALPMNPGQRLDH